MDELNLALAREVGQNAEITTVAEPNQRNEFKVLNFDGRLVGSLSCSHPPPIDLPPNLTLQQKFLEYTRLDMDLLKKLPSFLLEVDPYHGRNLTEWQTVLKIMYQHSRVAVLACEKCNIALCYDHGDPAESSIQPIQAYCGLLPHGLPLKTIATHSANLTKQSPAHPGVHPFYLDSLVHTHSSWVFGAIAELIDNARDARASKLEIFVSNVGMTGELKQPPVLCIRDNGKGMCHDEIMRMFSLGHEREATVDKAKIGKFGVGFKTGSLRIGDDVLVLTQGRDQRRGVLSQSIGFLSKSYNAWKQSLEMPIITFIGETFETVRLDETVIAKKDAEMVFESIARITGFDKARISAEFAVLEASSSDSGDPPSGTAIFIFNLKRDKNGFELSWQPEKGDIVTRSQRARSRPGQMASTVPLDCSLSEYIRFIFLDPRMSVHLQKKRVRSQQLTRLFGEPRQSTVMTIAGKPVKLKLGFIEAEKQRGGCGVFIYWHGRLIEAYKRVGRQLYDQDCGLGVIGVVEVSSLMDDGTEAAVKVLNSKQGFDDCEEYALLEKRLGNEFNAYWDRHFDQYKNELEPLSRVEAGVTLTEDVSYVQCDKCTKWRSLPPHVSPAQLEDTWFCWMAPFEGSCSLPEESLPGEDEVVTVQIGRSKRPQAPAHVLPSSSSAGRSPQGKKARAGDPRKPFLERSGSRKRNGDSDSLA